MLKMKLQYFGHLMWRADSLEKTLMLGKTKIATNHWTTIDRRVLDSTKKDTPHPREKEEPQQGRQQPAMELGALNPPVLPEGLWKQVSRTSAIVWPQANFREGTQPHPVTENWIKDLLTEPFHSHLLGFQIAQLEFHHLH